MTQALNVVPGVIKASTEYKTKLSTVEAKGKPCSLEGQEALLKVIREVGYEGKLISKD